MVNLLLILANLAFAGDLEKALALFDRLESTTVVAEYSRESVDAVLRDLQHQLEVPLRADWDSLIRLGVSPDDEVSLTLRETDGLAALQALALTLGDEFERPIFEAHAGQMVLTNVEATKDMRLLDVYDVRDLLRQTELIDTLRKERTPQQLDTPTRDEATGEDVPEKTAPGDVEDTTRRSPGRDLMMLLIEHVDPEAWLDYGGNFARIDERDGVLLVTAAPSVHRLMREALQSLRRTNPNQVQMDVVIADLPARQFELLRRRHTDGTVAFFEALRTSGPGAVIWKTNTAAALREQLEIDSEAAAASVHLELVPDLDPETGLISVRVLADVLLGDDHRRVQTTLRFTQGLPMGLIELPAAHPGETIRLLAVLTHPR